MLQLWDVLMRPRNKTCMRLETMPLQAVPLQAMPFQAMPLQAMPLRICLFPRLWLAALLHIPAMVDTLSAQRCLCRQCLCRHCYGALTFMQAVPVPLHLCRRCAFAGGAISGIICPVSVLL